LAIQVQREREKKLFRQKTVLKMMSLPPDLLSSNVGFSDCQCVVKNYKIYKTTNMTTGMSYKKHHEIKIVVLSNIAGFIINDLSMHMCLIILIIITSSPSCNSSFL